MKGKDIIMKTSKTLILLKKIIMTILLGGTMLCLQLPFVNVMRQNISYSGLDLLLHKQLTFKVITLGGGGEATLEIVNLLPWLVILFIIGALILMWIDKQNNKKLQVLTVILGILTMIGIIFTFLFITCDNDTIEIKVGTGIFAALLCMLCYIIYAASNKKTPIFEVNVYVVLMFLGVILVYPYINTLALAFDSSGENISVIPKQFTFNNFKFVLLNPKFYNGLWITITRTVLGTLTSLLCTLIFAYGLSKTYLIGQKFYMKMCIMTMYFSGGLIPVFIIFGKLGLVNNYLVYILPNLINVFNVILVVNYFRGIPAALEESAKIDGANDFQVLFKIMVPVAAPIVAVIGLFNAVFQWNSWYDAYLYMMGRPNLKPLQNVLIDIVNESQIDKFLANLPISIKSELTAAPVGKSIVAAAIILTIGPIILLYPLLQKYFLKGMMLGSVKE